MLQTPKNRGKDRVTKERKSRSEKSNLKVNIHFNKKIFHFFENNL